MLQSCACRVRLKSHPGSFVGGDLRKRLKEMNVKDSPRSGQAAEADFGELHHLNEARLKAGAHYTGITQKREFFLSEKPAEYLVVTGFADNPAKVYFAQAHACRGMTLKRFTLPTDTVGPRHSLPSEEMPHEPAQLQSRQP
jgi:hypothetical protein